jgi:MEMO1 family protein
LSSSTDIRPPQVAGAFYPASSARLESTINELADEVPARKFSGKMLAIIAPHAGYQYSGLTAAYAYKLLQGLSFQTVVVVSPSHREYFNGISIYNGAAYQTPLGTMKIDEPLRAALASTGGIISSSARGHRAEHAVEVHLPFIQKFLGNVNILPVVMGDQRREYCTHLGEKLGEALKGKSALLVASSDLSHFHPGSVANGLDSIAVRDVETFDPDKLIDDLESNRTEACGGGPIASVLIAAKVLGGTSVTILDHRNSGDVTGDQSSVVGYLSAAVFKEN